MIKIWVIKSGVKTVFLAFQGCFLTMSSRGLSPVCAYGEKGKSLECLFL